MATARSGMAVGRFKTAWARLSQAVAAALLAALFAVFILQIFSRYVLGSPFTWTLELCLTLWVWLVFWGNAFVVRHADHVRFDIFYASARPPIRRAFALFSAAAIIIGFVASLYPTWDFIDFLKIKKSATLRLPMRAVFSIYMLFMAAIIIAYIHRTIVIIRQGVEAADEVIPRTVAVPALIVQQDAEASDAHAAIHKNESS